MEAPQALSARFDVLRRLGEGGFGVVYEARDQRRGDTVAVKLLRRDHASAVYRFKREFRSLADVVHRNLVRLYELVATEDTHYFTMELVAGVDLRAHLCGDPALPAQTISVELTSSRAPNRASSRVATDVLAIRTAFAQLAEGVQALHDARKLHCDIKPSNVLVTREGRVVLLDFGLVAELDGNEGRSALGTPGYCAPEMQGGGALTFAADWYSVGAVLHEVLVGRLPVPGEPCDGGDPELRALCSELLAVDPQARPSGVEVIRRLGGSVPGAKPRSPLVGRDAELATLRKAWHDTATGDRPVLVRVIGASGLGKTALVERFLEEVDAVVLTGRCYEQESVPYKGMDALVDALAAYLRRTGHRPIDADEGALLARLFPVLRDVWSARPELDSSPEQRRRAFHGLRAVLRDVARDRPIACFLDDVQWGDVDSARLLRELLRPPDAPCMLVICSYREDARGGFLDAFDEGGLDVDDRRIELGALSESASRELARTLVGDDASAASISSEAHGSPLFLQQLAAGPAHAGSGLAALIVSRVGELDDPARRLVETIALAGQPIDEGVAIRAATLDDQASRTAALTIRHARLIVARKHGEVTLLAPAHDRIREALVAAMAETDARAGHRRIAEALVAMTQPEPDVLVWHYQRAGDNERTREFALAAAERADHALAFDRAAQFYSVVLDLTAQAASDRPQLLAKHARTLADAGRAADSAEAFERAADAFAGTDDELVHRRRAAELTLRSGRIALGTERMERVLRSVGVTPPRSRRSASTLAIVRRIRAFIRGFEPKPGVATSSPRLEALLSASTGVSMANHVLGDALHLQHMREALDSGEPSHVIRSLGHEATFQAVIGGSYLRKKCAAMLATIDALAKDDPYLRAWVRMSRGICAWFEGDWTTGWRETDAAMEGYRDCRGVAWELAMCNAYRLPSLAYLGEIAKLSEIVPEAYDAARELGDLFAANTLRLGQQGLVRLAEDRADVAIAEADAAIAPFPRDTYLGPHYHHLFAIAQANLYRGKPADAWNAIDGAWRELDKAKFLMAQCLRVEIRHLRARAAIAMAAVEPAQAKRLHAIALADANKIAKDDVRPAAPFAAMIRGSVAHARGDGDAAREAWTAAASGFDAASMALYASAARMRLGGDDAWMRGQGIARPDRMVAVLAP